MPWRVLEVVTGLGTGRSWPGQRQRQHSWEDTSKENSQCTSIPSRVPVGHKWHQSSLVGGGRGSESGLDPVKSRGSSWERPLVLGELGWMHWGPSCLGMQSPPGEVQYFPNSGISNHYRVIPVLIFKKLLHHFHPALINELIRAWERFGARGQGGKSGRGQSSGIVCGRESWRRRLGLGIGDVPTRVPSSQSSLGTGFCDWVQKWLVWGHRNVQAGKAAEEESVGGSCTAQDFSKPCSLLSPSFGI